MIVVENVFAYNYVREHPEKLKIVFEKNPLSHEPSAMGIRKGDQIFLNWLNNWIQYQWDQGTLQQLIDKWIVKGTYD
jgi:ABC-type amino acid transport substrate-binding protein